MASISLSPLLPALLVAWYRENARDLPWRRDREPYRVWVSEIMLQQTRVETVIPYYERFLAELPTIRALAASSDETLYKLWEGLGYYSRARNLRTAARAIEERHGGVFPTDYNDILALPGVGPYTAGAIASICFGARTPAVDGNVLRVVARLTELTEDIGSPAAKRAVSEALAEIYPDGEGILPGWPGDFTQALMELGATICLPNGPPRCLACPLSKVCAARMNGTAERYPVKAPKVARRVEELSVFLLRCEGALAVRRRAETGLLAGLWELPNVAGAFDECRALEIAAEWGVQPDGVFASYRRKHIFTHIEWRMACYAVNCRMQSTFFDWATKDDLEARYTLPTAFRRCLK